MKVFKNKFDRWETLFSNHLLNNEQIKYYMPVQFQKGQEPMADSIDINPIRWWGSCFMTKEGQVKPKIFIAEWEQLEVKGTVDKSIETFKAENYAEYQEKHEDVPKNGTLDISAEELPFY